MIYRNDSIRRIRGAFHGSDRSDTDVDEAAVSAFLDASRALVGIAVHSVNAAPGDLTVHAVPAAGGGRRQGPLTISDVAVLLGVVQSNATRHCDRLQRLGLLERRRSAEDRRIVLVHVTDAGREVVDVRHRAAAPSDPRWCSPR